ncbi:MAG: aminotransferase class III-fold pyridoxal phosphate-dependent enzyme [Oligoflexia bacterium]|nr:aminotransferase class III-fold pyridoxal phosphate-dependent enzyme [Oligoflexia bacterium]
MSANYFYTWSAQNTANRFPIDDCQEFTFTSNKKLIHELSSISFHANFGFKNSTIENSISNQLSVFPVSSAKAQYSLKEDVTTKLLSLLKLEGKIFYTVSGAESVENALKMARLYTGKKVIAARKKSYHGATLGALDVTGDWRNQASITNDDLVLRLPDYQDDVDASQTIKLLENNKTKLAALILETIPGANGVYVPTKDYLLTLQKYCKTNDIVFILDEVICGFYRTGIPFAYQHYDLAPDIVCMAKGISGGFIPFGAVFVSDEIANYFNDKILPCGLTNYAHPLGLASLEGVFKLTESTEFQETLKSNLKAFEEFLSNISNLDIVEDCRYLGLLSALQLNTNIEWKDFYSSGLSLVVIKEENGCRIILSPFLNSETAILKEALNNLHSFLKTRN